MQLSVTLDPTEEKRIKYNSFKNIKLQPLSKTRDVQLTETETNAQNIWWETIQKAKHRKLKMQRNKPHIQLTYTSFELLLPILNDVLKGDNSVIATIIVSYLHHKAISIDLIGGICKKHYKIQQQIAKTQKLCDCDFGCTDGTSSFSLFVRLCQSKNTKKIYGEIMEAFITTNFVKKRERNKKVKGSYTRMTVYTSLPKTDIIKSHDDFPKYQSLKELIWSNWSIEDYALKSLKDSKYFIMFSICKTSIGNGVDVCHCDGKGNIIDSTELAGPDDW